MTTYQKKGYQRQRKEELKKIKKETLNQPNVIIYTINFGSETVSP